MMTTARAKSPTSASRFSGVKVFSASTYTYRGQLGETVTEWLAAHPEMELVDMVVTQSSDASFHLISICVFYKGELAAAGAPLEGPRVAAIRYAGWSASHNANSE